MLSLIIPTYNERENLPILLKELFFLFKKHRIPAEVIIVDDNSPDHTANLVEELKKKYPSLHLIRRPGKLGLSSAVLTGFQKAKGELLGVMDADLSHPPEALPRLYQAITTIIPEKSRPPDFVIGSRYTKGGKILGWPLYRKIISQGATLLARPFTKAKDPMSGLFIIRKKCLHHRLCRNPCQKASEHRNTRQTRHALSLKKHFNSGAINSSREGANGRVSTEPNNLTFNPKGFKICLELLVKANWKIVKEVPITFKDRTHGQSKATLKEYYAYLHNLAHYTKYRWPSFAQLIQFGIVGGLGTIINLLILYSFTEFLGLYYLYSAVFAFFIALTFNFILNKIWTFEEKFRQYPLKKITYQYSLFFLFSLLALAVNLFFLHLFVEKFHFWYIFAQLLAILLAYLVNFAGSKLLVFRQPQNKTEKRWP